MRPTEVEMVHAIGAEIVPSVAVPLSGRGVALTSESPSVATSRHCAEPSTLSDDRSSHFHRCPVSCRPRRSPRRRNSVNGRRMREVLERARGVGTRRASPMSPTAERSTTSSWIVCTTHCARFPTPVHASLRRVCAVSPTSIRCSRVPTRRSARRARPHRHAAAGYRRSARRPQHWYRKPKARAGRGRATRRTRRRSAKGSIVGDPRQDWTPRRDRAA